MTIFNTIADISSRTLSTDFISHLNTIRKANLNMKHLATKLTLGILVIISAIYLLIGTWSVNSVNTRLREDLEAQILAQTGQAVSEISTVFAIAEQVAKQASQDRTIQQYLREVQTHDQIKTNPLYKTVSETLVSYRETSENLLFVWIANDAANFYTDNTCIISGTEYITSSRPWYAPAMNTNGVAFTAPYADYGTGSYVVSAVIKIDDPKSNHNSFVSADVALTSIPGIMKNNEIGEYGTNFLFAKDGSVIYSEFEEYMVDGFTINNIPEFREAITDVLSGGSNIIEIFFNGEDYILAYEPLSINGWGVFQLINIKEATTESRNFANIMIIIFFISGLALAIIVYITITRTMEPLNIAAKQARILGQGDFTKDLTSIYAKRNDEIGDLSKAFSEMNTSMRSLVEEVISFSNLDPLTGISNRRRFLEYFEEALSKQHSGAVVMVDLDNFKEINDTMGHVYGDKVLVKISNLLLELEEDSNIKISRFGGDEFLILIDHVSGLEEIDKRVKKIFQIFSNKLYIGEDAINISISMGVSVYPNDSLQVNQLIMNADLAMYRVKRNGKKNYVYFDNSMTDEMIERTRITRILHQAISEDGFTLLYQPIIDITNRNIVGFEALIRMKNNELYPNVFIPIAEEDGSIHIIGRWVVKEVLIQLTQWRELGLKLKPVSINFSAKQIEDNEFVAYLMNLLEKYQISPELIIIEITETAIMENKEVALHMLNQLKEIGIKLSLDDFGTGYSSLSYLTFLPIDKIKLDKSLCDRYLEPTSIRVLENIIDISHTLGMHVIAEGIEEEYQFHSLKEIGCDMIQGYLFSKPINPQKIIQIYHDTFQIND